MISFFCSNCGTKISAEAEHAGAAASCPSCNHDLVVPGNPGQPVIIHAHNAATPPSTQAENSQFDTGEESLFAPMGVIFAKLKRSASKKWVIPGAAVLGLLLIVTVCNRPEKPSYQEMGRESSARPCSACNGTGQQGSTGCPDCKTMFDEFSGQGTVRTPSGHVIVCSRCQGSGTVPLRCSRCGGAGSL